jgi:hypothetical protein
MADKNDFAEEDFLRKEIHALVHGRYGNMSVYQTIAVLETVKMDLWDQLERWHGEEKGNEAEESDEG